MRFVEKKMIIIKRNVVEKSFSIQILRFVVTIKSRVVKMIETSTQLKFSVNEFQIEEFEMNIDVNATKSQNENDFVSKNDFEKNISNEMQKITNEKLKTKIELQRRFDEINVRKKRLLLKRRFHETKTNEIAEFFEKISVFIKTLNKIKKQKKYFVINIFNKYKETNQRKFDIYIYEIETVFEIRSMIYAKNRQKIFYVQKFFEKILIDD